MNRVHSRFYYYADYIFWSTEHSVRQWLVNNLESNHTVGDISTDNESPFWILNKELIAVLRMQANKYRNRYHNHLQQFNKYEWIDLLTKVFCLISFGRTPLFFFLFVFVKSKDFYIVWNMNCGLRYCMLCRHSNYIHL